MPTTPEPEDKEPPIARKLDLEFEEDLALEKAKDGASPPKKKKGGRPIRKAAQPKKVVEEKEEPPNDKEEQLENEESLLPRGRKKESLKGSTQRGKKVQKEVEEKDESGPETSAKKQKIADTTSPSRISQQEIWKPRFDDQLKRSNHRYRGTKNSYFIDILEQVCSSFLPVIPMDPSPPVPLSAKKQNKSKTKEPKTLNTLNPTNIEFDKKHREL